jgi:hypothetical protein
MQRMQRFEIGRELQPMSVKQQNYFTCLLMAP